MMSNSNNKQRRYAKCPIYTESKCKYVSYIYLFCLYPKDIILLSDFVKFINILENKEYTESDLICSEYLKNETRDLIIFLENDFFSGDIEVYTLYAGEEEPEFDRCPNEVYINRDKMTRMYLKIKTLIEKQMVLIDGLEENIKIIENKRIIKEIGNNISKDVLNYIVFDYLDYY